MDKKQMEKVRERMQRSISKQTGEKHVAVEGGRQDEEVVVFLDKLKQFEQESRKSRVMVS